MNDASNASALIILAAVSLAGATIGAILGAIRFARLELQDQWTGAEIIPMCSCGDSWCPYIPNQAQKAWWKP